MIDRFNCRFRRTRRIYDDHFKLYRTNCTEKRDKTLEEYLTFDPNLYWIYKTTGVQKEVSYQDVLDFNFSGYTFFKKDLYSNIEINKWIDFLYTFMYIPYLSRPFPPIEIIDKIKIKK